MFCRFTWLSTNPLVFRAMTGLAVDEFTNLVRNLEPDYKKAEHDRWSSRTRLRQIGAGCKVILTPRDQLLLTIVWLRKYPTEPVLGYLFGIDDRAAGRTVKRLVPLLEATGRATMRMPQSGKKRTNLPDLLKGVPELLILVDSFEQKVQRPKNYEEQKRWYSGKKKTHTVKTQVGIDKATGRFVDVTGNVHGPCHDKKLLENSKLLDRLPKDVGICGDSAYRGMDKMHEKTLVPRRKPNKRERPQEVGVTRCPLSISIQD